jgi:hypothetical protein
MSSHVTSCIHHVPSSKRVSSSITPMINLVWKFFPRWVMSCLTLEPEKVLFRSKRLIELDQEDRVMKHNTNIVVNHHPILQGAMLPTHERKSGMSDHGVFILSTIPLSFLLRNQCTLHHFLCPLLRKSREISFKGGGL